MSRLLIPRKLIALYFVLLTFQSVADENKNSPATLRLYTLDCGVIMLEPRAMNLFEDTDAYATTPGVMAVPCFLIRHPRGDFVWDTGLGDALAGKGVVNLGDGFSAKVELSLVEQLQAINLTPQGVDFVAFSHHHFDHTSNAGLFTQARYLINRKEMAWTRGSPFGVDSKTLASVSESNTLFIEHDYDVFDDGSVRILRAPGHTPGHQVLMLKLANAGVVILSGDLYHTRKNFHRSRVAALNDSRAETLASFDRIEKLIEKFDARMVIQHDREDFLALPRLPGYLD